MNFAGAPGLELTLMSDFLACHFEQIHRNHHFIFTNNETLLVILSVFFIDLNWVDLSKTVFKLAWDFQKAADGIVTHDPGMGLPGCHVMCWSKGRPANPTSPSFYIKKGKLMKFERHSYEHQN